MGSGTHIGSGRFSVEGVGVRVERGVRWSKWQSGWKELEEDITL